jgi:hypothetical protein
MSSRRSGTRQTSTTTKIAKVVGAVGTLGAVGYAVKAGIDWSRDNAQQPQNRRAAAVVRFATEEDALSVLAAVNQINRWRPIANVGNSSPLIILTIYGEGNVTVYDDSETNNAATKGYLQPDVAAAKWKTPQKIRIARIVEKVWEFFVPDPVHPDLVELTWLPY